MLGARRGFRTSAAQQPGQIVRFRPLTLGERNDLVVPTTSPQKLISGRNYLIMRGGDIDGGVGHGFFAERLRPAFVLV
jgi:hypothetical protein